MWMSERERTSTEPGGLKEGRATPRVVSRDFEGPRPNRHCLRWCSVHHLEILTAKGRLENHQNRNVFVGEVYRLFGE